MGWIVLGAIGLFISAAMAGVYLWVNRGAGAAARTVRDGGLTGLVGTAAGGAGALAGLAGAAASGAGSLAGSAVSDVAHKARNAVDSISDRVEDATNAVLDTSVGGAAAAILGDHIDRTTTVVGSRAEDATVEIVRSAPVVHAAATPTHHDRLVESASASTRYFTPEVGQPQATLTTRSDGSSWWWVVPGLIALGAIAFMVLKSLATGGFDGWKWLLWSLLGLGGLLSVTGLLTMMRRHPLVDEKRGAARGLGLITLLSGLLLGGAGLFAWMPRIHGLADMGDSLQTTRASYDALVKENASLEGRLKSFGGLSEELGKLKLANADLSTRNGTLSAEVADLTARLKANAGNADEIKRLNGVVSGLKTDNDGLTAEIARLKNVMGSSQPDTAEIERLRASIAGLQKDADARSAQIARLEGELDVNRADGKRKDGRIAELEAELAKPRPVETRTVYVEKPAAETPKDDVLLNLRGAGYVVEPMTQPLFSGQKGRTYRVVLLQPDGSRYKFATASYSRIVPSDSFKKAADAAVRDIETKLAGRKYQLYALGSASASSYSGKREKGYQYKRISVMTRGADGTYDGTMADRTFSDPITNADLPNLRSAYVQEYIAANYNVSKPIILDGVVSASADEAEQAVSLILAVEE